MFKPVIRISALSLDRNLVGPVSITLRRQVFLEQKLGCVAVGVGHGDSTQEMPNGSSDPVEESDQRTGYHADGLERLLLDIELAVEPVEAEIETAGCFEEKAGSHVEPKLDGCEEAGK